MKAIKKIFSLFAVIVMLYVCCNTISASTITVKPPVGTDANAENTYNLYKIFDATVSGDAVSYTLPNNVTDPPSGFSVDSAGNVKLTRTTGTLTELTEEEISGIKTYVTTNADKLTHLTRTVKGTTNAEFDDLGAGYYYITTTTGTFVMVKTNNADVTIQDKNTVPELTKEITNASGSITDKNGNIINPNQSDELGKNAIAQVGTEVSFESIIAVGKGMKSYVFHDTMDAGLSLNTSSIEVTYSAKPAGYTEATPVTSKVEGKDTITIEFYDGLAEGTTITITYKAVVTNQALTILPEKNTAYVEYGNGPTHGKTPEQITNTYSAKISVIKKDGKNTEADTDDSGLSGAKFKLYKLDGTTKKYYKLNVADTNNPASITWVETGGDEHESLSDGSVPVFIGLNDGTYYLEESFTPAGYNTAADVEVTITGYDYTAANLEQEKTVINNKGSVLPTTGGIGTTIFHIAGAGLAIGAAVLLISKKRMNNNWFLDD